jgi:post-segregation antitoxin (ccd killing protein)
MNRADKKARLAAWREEQLDGTRAAFPLKDADMKALFDMLDERLPEAGCAHTRGLTDAWLTEHGHSIAEVHQWLDENGGFCDCEVLANSEQAWREATGRR